MLLTAFDAGTPDLGWYVVDDGVMGGRSRGSFRIEAGQLLFTGVTNTKGGGFSSIRSESRPLDLSAFEGLRLQLAGDGRRYIFRIETADGTAYWAEFATDPAGIRSERELPFGRFRPHFRGRWLDGPALDPGAVTSLGLMIYDGLDGPFRLEVDRIEAY